MTAKLFVLAAGGTGGHMVPAHALARELKDRGHKVALVTDARGSKIPGLFDGVATHVLPAGRLTGRPTSWLPGVRAIMQGRAQARALYKQRKPAAVIGFGGYPAYPALAAAFGMGVKTAVHEQNAVLGRVNRLVAARVDAIATSYPDTARVRASCEDKVRLVGNPVRAEVIAIGTRPYPAVGGTFHLLVTGGSQGATVMSRVVPEAFALLPDNLRSRLSVVQQARAEDMDAVRARYEKLAIKAEIATYLTDLPERLAVAHLVIGRAGASTISELTAAGRPAILIPLPSAMDDHQTANAREMADAGGAIVLTEAHITPQRLADAIADLAARLPEAAAAALSVGRPEAVRLLADLVESLDNTTAPQLVGAAKLQPVPA
ncbi:undecaprenyldiphospho-muramoylpentapeptide beta-N-acetylglucosaminyltransferase [Sphingomonas antarctica]|uniref:undecaprenyldiphospho-muramoylpentapeptide beta-N-acetylglucosaminyltransferase n=1 Tax=Sphingomonas antarctica TaxID=2040274 RepID=UPI0039EAB616